MLFAFVSPANSGGQEEGCEVVICGWQAKNNSKWNVGTAFLALVSLENNLVLLSGGNSGTADFTEPRELFGIFQC